MAASKAWLAGRLLEKSTATEHATSSSSTATEHATFSSSTATEHATSYASASVSSDGVHLAENFAKWQPPAPGKLRGKWRDIGEILTCCTDDMGWKALQDVGRKYPGGTLATLDWRLLLQQLWKSAIKEGIRCNSGVVQPADWHDEMDVETWQKILFACELDTVEGLRKYVEAWFGEDRLVLQWMQGAVKCKKPTADIGGWLADYCNTAFLVLSKQGKPNIKFRVVSNALYKSLADLIGPWGMSAESSGNVWEQLCWHAFEHDRGAFVLSVIWNTTYRCMHSEKNSASVSQPSVSHTAAQEDSEMKNADNPYEVDWGGDAESSLPDTASVSQPSAKDIVDEMKAWYAERAGDTSVATTWKHLHKCLFKKVTVPYAADVWSQSASVSQPSADEETDHVDGIPMVVSEEFVASQVKNLIERREKWLRDNNLLLSTVMNGAQRDKFLAELKDEYHNSADQLRRQERDRQNGKKLQAGRKQRWSRECQRRGGTTQMFHLLSFSGRWDPRFFEKEPVPTVEPSEEERRATSAAVEARAKVRLARKYEHLKKKTRLYPDQMELVKKLQNGTLEEEAARLTQISGHGRFKRADGSFVDIGGSTGGFTRAVLYNWTPPNLDDDFQ